MAVEIKVNFTVSILQNADLTFTCCCKQCLTGIWYIYYKVIIIRLFTNIYITSIYYCGRTAVC